MDVRLLLQGTTDVPVVRHAGHGYYDELLRTGRPDLRVSRTRPPRQEPGRRRLRIGHGLEQSRFPLLPIQRRVQPGDPRPRDGRRDGGRVPQDLALSNEILPRTGGAGPCATAPSTAWPGCSRRCCRAGTARPVRTSSRREHLVSGNAPVGKWPLGFRDHGVPPLLVASEIGGHRGSLLSAAQAAASICRWAQMPCIASTTWW